MTSVVRTWSSSVIIVLVLCGMFRTTAWSALPPAKQPVAHWKLTTDFRDTGPQGLHGTGHGVTFSKDPVTPQRSSAQFAGQGQFVEVASHQVLNPGVDDFTISLWLNTDVLLDDDLGDLVSKFDPVTRTGFQLSLRNNTGVTSNLSNSRQLQFGIDSGTEPVWTDVGRPGNSLFAFSLAVHHGNLYAGTCEPGKDQVGHVYRYEGGQQWSDCGTLDNANSVTSLVPFEGSLYAGTGKYRVAGSALPESENLQFGGRVYRLLPDGKWQPCGQLPDTEAIGGMTVFKGRLYASSLYRPAGFFRYEGGEKWTSLPTPNGKRTEALGVFNGYLWATGYDEGHVYRFDGENWTDMGRLGENTQTYAFAIHEGRLSVATWPSARVFRLGDHDRWEDLGRLGEELEVMGMLIHNGKFYAGTLPLAEVHRYDGGQTWTKLKRLDDTENVKYRRAWTMAQFQGKLFVSTLPSGKIYSMEAGRCVTFDQELPAGRRHVAAVKRADRLELFVDGKLVATSTPFPGNQYQLTNSVPLRIGAGAGDTFKGQLMDVQIFRHALLPADIEQIAQQTQP